MAINRILIVEDTPSLALAYARQLEAAGYETQMADTGAAMRALVMAGAAFDAILLDLQLPDCDGLELLAGMTAITEVTKVIVVTADGSIDRAVQATRLGAYDFLVKPVKPERLLTTVRNATEYTTMARTVEQVRRESNREEFHGFVGGAPAMRAVYQAIESVAQSRATVFITGESGTGKEVAAEAIHTCSQRRSGPFIAVNCGAIPENLLESELFGHRKGAFTGAIDHNMGAVRAANGGTLFLDEICEMDIRLQVKLLRFLQTGRVQPVGASAPEAVDVRVVCATNRDPMQEVAEGRFREDLFYRLAVIPLYLPPLRERGEDIELIAKAFLRRFIKEEGRLPGRFEAGAVRSLHTHRWPGNVRELQNAVRRSVVMNSGPSYPLMFQAAAPDRYGDSQISAAQPPSPMAPPLPAASSMLDLTGLSLDDVERIAIQRAIDGAGGNLPLAAARLGVSPSTLYRKRERWQETLQTAAQVPPPR